MFICEFFHYLLGCCEKVIWVFHTTRLKEKEKLDQEGGAAAAASTTDIKSDLRPIYKHMREMQTELTVWIEQSASLKDKLKSRFSSLCDIQEEVTKALNTGADEGGGGGVMEFRSIEAAKFVGEVLYMKQENNKVRDELNSGLERVRALQNEMEKTLGKLDEEFGMSKNNNQPQLRHSASRARVPLRSFIFGTKPKKKSSIFSCMHHMHQRKYQELKAAFPM